MQVGHLQEFVDQEKTKVEETDVNPNLRLDRERENEGNALEEDLPIKIIHMIGVPHDFKLENMIQGKSILTSK